MSEERAQKRRKARKEPVEIVELSRLTLEPQTALIIRLPSKAGLGDAAWLETLKAQLPEKATALVVERAARIEIVQRGKRQEI